MSRRTTGDGVVVTNDLANDEGEEFFREIGIEPGSLCEFAQTRDLRGFTVRIRCGKTGGSLEFAHGLRLTKALGEHVDQRGIDVVDALAVQFQLGARAVNRDRGRSRRGGRLSPRQGQ